MIRQLTSLSDLESAIVLLRDQIGKIGVYIMHSYLSEFEAFILWNLFLGFLEGRRKLQADK